MSTPSEGGEYEWGIALFLTEKTPNPEICLDPESSVVIHQAMFFNEIGVCEAKDLGGLHSWSP